MELFPDGTRFERSLTDVGLACAVALPIWLLGHGIVVVPIVASALLLGFTVRRVRRPLRRILLTETQVLECMGSEVVRVIDLGAVGRIESEFVLNGSPQVRLVSRTGATITFALHELAKEFVRKLGDQLVDRRAEIHVGKSMVKALGWPPKTTQWD